MEKIYRIRRKLKLNIKELLIPFLMRDLDKKKQKERTEVDLKNMLIVIRNLIMYCLNYYHLNDNLNFNV